MSRSTRQASHAAQPQLTTLEGRQLLTTLPSLRSNFVVTHLVTTDAVTTHAASATTPVPYTVRVGVPTTTGAGALGRTIANQAIPKINVTTLPTAAARSTLTVVTNHGKGTLATTSTISIVNPTVVKAKHLALSTAQFVTPSAAYTVVEGSAPGDSAATRSYGVLTHSL